MVVVAASWPTEHLHTLHIGHHSPSQVGTIDTAHKGKVESYMLSLLANNPDRPFVKGAVFNGAEVVLHMAVREEKGTQLFESHELNLLSGAIT